VIKNHINPYFGDMRLSQFTPLRIRDFMFYLEEKGLSLASRGKIFRYLKSMLQMAWQWELIARDPSSLIQGPREERKEMDFLTADEVKKLLDSSRGEVRALLSVACLAGLRQGEVLGLKWGDVDFEDRHIRVVRNYSPVHGFGPPKTESSRRSVPLIPTLAIILREHYEAQGRPAADCLVFPNRNGKPNDRANLSKRMFKGALRRAGLRMIRFHDLRHTYASLCIEAGINPKALQLALGHSSVETTLDIYTHLFPGSFDNAIMKLEAILAE